jgi:hypothetical protein
MVSWALRNKLLPAWWQLEPRVLASWGRRTQQPWKPLSGVHLAQAQPCYSTDPHNQHFQRPLGCAPLPQLRYFRYRSFFLCCLCLHRIHKSKSRQFSCDFSCLGVGVWRITAPSQPGQNLETLDEEQTKNSISGDVTQVVKYFLSKLRALSSMPSTSKN